MAEKTRVRIFQVFGLLALILVFPFSGGQAQWKIESGDGSSFIKVGFLAQGQGEWIQVPDMEDPEEMEDSYNLFFRRLRFLAGGQLSENVSFFFETDSPGLGKAGDGGVKGASDMYVQDAFLTYSFADWLKIDGGMILIPKVYNSEQSAATLLPIDYSPYSFLASGPTGSRVGRDYGVQLRGYPFGKHVEYRAGIYQGMREAQSENDFRYSARLMLHLLDPQTGFFYTGTSLGNKRILDIGVSWDHQMEYNAYGADFFWDQPLGNGDGITVQVDYLYYDGDETFPELLGQNNWLGELGYYNARTRLGIFGQAAIKAYPDEDYEDFNEARYQGGIAYWAMGHNFNLKLGYTQITVENEDIEDRDQVILQCQGFMY